MNTFDQTVVDAVLAHMGDDHGEDNIIIARGNGAPEASASQMIDLDGEGGVWRVTENGETRELRISWPDGPITERPQIRRAVVILYRNACKQLGIDPMQDEASHEPAKPFSQVIREGSWSDHDDSEGADFMASIMRGTATRDDYVALVAQHFFMYEALEAVVDEVVNDERFAPFHDENLRRLAALNDDLTVLIGENWRDEIKPVPATAEYAERIRQVGAEGWVPGIIAHHYTRYLGDLSGGQMIAKRVVRQHGFENGEGTKFYDFKELGSLPGFKERYREALDALGESFNDVEQARMLHEVRRAYGFNTAVFIDMAKAKQQ
ncbi:biliverdin-producing heme oxygenase [Leucobacter sp. UCMA 4100]|uniref:biliverdin-producing heme oxygenase n=1 Tax=Leucobacter sp. UCMA 4100 TaxID=2810534 RepID=UPI0022EA7BBB|nr:biliverdin-producing heme oxygenase [Leucobacter sp. UCMA 4100]